MSVAQTAKRVRKIRRLGKKDIRMWAQRGVVKAVKSTAKGK